jgi:hypothetical protein
MWQSFGKVGDLLGITFLVAIVRMLQVGGSFPESCLSGIAPDFCAFGSSLMRASTFGSQSLRMITSNQRVDPDSSGCQSNGAYDACLAKKLSSARLQRFFWHISLLNNEMCVEQESGCREPARLAQPLRGAVSRLLLLLALFLTQAHAFWNLFCEAAEWDQLLSHS